MHDLDKYEEDEDEDAEMNDLQPGEEKVEKIDKKLSYIYFRPLNEHKNLKDWHYKLQS